MDARHFAYAFTPGEYEIKPKNIRSLDANAYAWALIDKLANATGVPSSEVYRRAVRDVGGNMKIVCIQSAAAEELRQVWASNGLGWQSDVTASKIPEIQQQRKDDLQLVRVATGRKAIPEDSPDAEAREFIKAAH